MRTVGIYEAKAKFSSLLDEVERGSVVTITRHGKAIARLEPVEHLLRTPEEIDAILQEFESFRSDHRGALAGLSIREMIEDGRKY
jgi:prevent-host-death family protein